MPRRALCLLALAGCARLTFPGLPATPVPGRDALAPTRGGKPALTVLLAAGVPRADAVRAAITRAFGKSFTLSFAAPPSVPPAREDHTAIEAQLGAARKAYVNADFEPCLDHLGEIQRVGDLLAAGERLLGERLLFWRVACRVGAGRLADARRDAAVFAAYGLSVPPDVDAATPDIEGILADALRAVAAAPRQPLRVTAVPAEGRHPPHAVVSVDGRRDLCVAPCAVDLPPGDHAVRVDADGFQPESRVVRVDGESGGAIAFTLSPADPDLAARQWTARHAGSPAVDAAASVALLGTALRARHLAVVTVEPAAQGTRLTGALALDGGIAARAERAGPDGDVPDAATALLRDLLLRGRLLDPAPPLHARPLFWVGVGLAAAAAATVTALLLYEPEQQIRVGL